MVHRTQNKVTSLRCTFAPECTKKCNRKLLVILHRGGLEKFGSQNAFRPKHANSNRKRFSIGDTQIATHSVFLDRRESLAIPCAATTIAITHPKSREILVHSASCVCAGMRSWRSLMSVDPIMRAPLLATMSGSIPRSSADCHSTCCTSSCMMLKIWLHDLPESNVTFWQEGSVLSEIAAIERIAPCPCCLQRFHF